MKQSIILFEIDTTIEKLAEDQLIHIKGGRKGCPHDDDDD